MLRMDGYALTESQLGFLVLSCLFSSFQIPYFKKTCASYLGIFTAPFSLTKQ